MVVVVDKIIELGQLEFLSAFLKSSENIRSSTMSVQNHILLTSWTFPTFLAQFPNHAKY